MRERIPPRPLVGIGAFVLYLLVFYGVWIARGIDYPRIGESAETLFNWYALPLIAGAVVLVVVTTWLGWWKPAMVEHLRLPRWTAVPAVLMAVLAIVTLAGKDYSGTTSTMLLWCVVGSLGVGFCEELASRGLLLVSLRPALSERLVWIVSTLLFGLMHLPNWAFGAGPAAVAQVGTAALTGCTLYLLRRASGGLIWAMVLHGLWDFAMFIGAGVSLAPVLSLLLGIASAVIAFVVTRPGRNPA